MVDQVFSSGGHIQRREFITLFVSMAAMPLAAQAQQPVRPKRIAPSLARLSKSVKWA